jgi:hypothetical protein
MSEKQLSTEQALRLFNTVINPLTDRQAKSVLCHIVGALGHNSCFWRSVKEAVETEHEIDRRVAEASHE